MPRHIIDENGKRIRLWTDEEIFARYRQGREEAGGKINPAHIYTEEDLKSAFTKGAELNDRLVGPAARAGYEEGYHQGYHEGELTGRNLSQRETLSSMAEQLDKAKKEGYSDGYTKGCEAQDAYNSGFISGERYTHQRLMQDLEREKQKFANDAIEHYKKSMRILTRAANFASQIASRGLLGSLASFVGKLPLGHSDDKHRSGLTYEDSKLTLADIRKFPIRVPARFATRYIAPPLIVGGLTMKAYSAMVQVHYDITERRDQHRHGETDEQYTTRKHTEIGCSQLEKITPELVGVDKFNPTQEDTINHHKIACKNADVFYQSMIKTMKLRKESGIGNQKYYGLRTEAGHNDTYKDNRIIASPGIAINVTKLNEELIQSGVKTGNRGTLASASKTGLSLFPFGKGNRTSQQATQNNHQESNRVEVVVNQSPRSQL